MSRPINPPPPLTSPPGSGSPPPPPPTEAAEHRRRGPRGHRRRRAAPVFDAAGVAGADLGHGAIVPSQMPVADRSPRERRRPRIADRAGADQRAVVAQAGRGDRARRGPCPTREMASISSWAALKNVAANPSATSPPTTTRSRSSTVQIVPTARPTSRPVRRMMSYVGSVGGRPVIVLDRGARRLGLETAAGTARAAPSVGFDDDVADVAGVAGRPVDEVAVEDEPAVDAASTPTIVQKLWGPAPPRASPRPGPVALASRSPNTGSPVSSRRCWRSWNAPPRRHARRRDGLAVALDRSGARRRRSPAP